jgi:AcrR family transcriptional regulator
MKSASPAINTNIRREEILEVALHCFNERGYHKATIDYIAEKVGITKGGIYYYFRSKKEIFIELFHFNVMAILEKLVADVYANPEADEAVWRILDNPETDYKNKIDIYRFGIEFLIIGARDPDIKKEVVLFYNKRVELYKKIILDGIAKGTFKDIDPESAAWNLNFLSTGFSFLLTYFTGESIFDKLEKHAINMKLFFNGIKRENIQQ